MHKGYRCLDSKTKCVYISRHVVFYETTSPFKPSNEATSPPNLELVEFPTVDEWKESKFHIDKAFIVDYFSFHPSPFDPCLTLILSL